MPRIEADIAATFPSNDAGSSSGRSKLFPEGSPTRPVAPPTSATAWWPERMNQESTIRPRRLPRWRLSAVGSKPQ